MNEPMRRDGGIVTAIRSGDMRRAFELLIIGCQEGIYSYCVRLTRHGDALTVYSQVLKAAATELRRLDLLPRAWLYSIAREVIVHYHGRQRVDGALGEGYAPIGAPDAAPNEEDPLAALDPLPREILQLALWQGLKLREVAYVLRRPLADVRHEAARGLRHAAIYSRRGEEQLLS